MNKTVDTYCSKHLLLLAVGLAFSVTTTFGQEGNLPVTGEQQEQPVVNPNVAPTEEGMQLWEDQSNEVIETTTEKKTSSESQAASTPTREDNEKVIQPGGDDSVISFNFLYYLFQKFKLSENVE